MKKNRYIALCSNIPVFWENKLLDADWCQKFPGSSWMPTLAKMAEKEGYTVISGDVALKLIRDNSCSANDVFVVQELNAKHGLKLLDQKAQPALLTACESPLFSYYFYDNVSKIASKFKYRKLFQGTFKDVNSSGKDIAMKFPSFSNAKLPEVKPWNDKKFMVMVAANKSGFAPMPKTGLKSKIIWMVHRTYKLFSNAFQMAYKSQLHKERLLLIEYFAKKNLLKLYGSNWLSKELYTDKELETIYPSIQKLNPGFCDDKIETISDYKFTICFENITYDGYVTEKIIDCLVAGTIPIYMGASDISDFVPKECFIDYRDFNTLDQLTTYLNELDKNAAEEIINCGRAFLLSKEGQSFSYEHFSQEILDIVKEVDNEQ